MLDLVGKSICCILCRGSILYFDETGITKFGRHMQFEHGAMHDFDFMMAACKMNDSEKKALVEVFNKKNESVDGVKDDPVTSPRTPCTPKKSDKENQKSAVKRTPKKKENVAPVVKLANCSSETVRLDVAKDIPSDAKVNSSRDTEEVKRSKDPKENKTFKSTYEAKQIKNVVVESCKMEKDVKPYRETREVKEFKDNKEAKLSKIIDPHTFTPTAPRKSDLDGVKTPKITLENKDMKKETIEELVAHQKKKKLRLLMKSKSKHTSRYSSKIKNSQDSKSKIEKCRHCEKIFKNNQKLLKHLEKEHPGLKRNLKKYSCDKCSVSFKVKSELKEHFKTAHVKSELKKKTNLDSPKTSAESESISTALRRDSEKMVVEDAANLSRQTISSPVADVSGGMKEVDKSKVDNNNGDVLELAGSENQKSTKRLKVEAESAEVRGKLHHDVGTRKSPRKVLTDPQASSKKINSEEKVSSKEMNVEEKCALCVEYSNNFSKLRRHQKYVHGIKGIDFKYLEATEHDLENEDEMEEEKNSTPELETHATKVEETVNKELRSCLKKSTLTSQKRSISFNETIFYKEFNKDEALYEQKDENNADESKPSQPDAVAIQAQTEADVSPRPVGRPRKSPPSSPSSSSPKSPKSTPVKKRKGDVEQLSQPSTKKQMTDSALTDNNEDEFEADTATAIKLSLESTNSIDDQTTETEYSHSVADSLPHTIAMNRMKQPTEKVLLFPCEQCGISLESKEELLAHLHSCTNNHEMVVGKISDIEGVNLANKNKVTVDAETDGKSEVEETNTDDNLEVKFNKSVGSGRDYKMKRKRRDSLTLNESSDEVVQKQELENIKKLDVKSEESYPNTDFVLKQEHLSEALLNESSDGGMGGMVSFPMDSFLETILTEEPVEARLHDAIDSFTANLKANNVKSKSMTTTLNESIAEPEPISNPTFKERNQSEPFIKPSEEDPDSVVKITKESEGLSESLQLKYSQAAKRVDFTQSSFFMQHVELIGKSVNGGGFKEDNIFLPEGWKMKTFNEVKKFFLTPDFVVLKSPTAVIEYLRLSLNLSHDDLKSLSKNLKIVGKQFDRYLDELYDDCVVLE